jgi:hypothetical protein
MGWIRTVILALLLVFAAAASRETIFLFQWKDNLGRIHYSNNLESIPEAFRKSAVRGSFVPDAKPRHPKAKCDNALPTLADSNLIARADMLRVEGRIANGSTQAISQVRVIVRFYDAQEQFVKSESAYADPLELLPCERGQFSIETPRSDDIDHFKIEFTWN